MELLRIPLRGYDQSEAHGVIGKSPAYDDLRALGEAVVTRAGLRPSSEAVYEVGLRALEAVWHALELRGTSWFNGVVTRWTPRRLEWLAVPDRAVDLVAVRVPADDDRVRYMLALFPPDTPLDEIYALMSAVTWRDVEIEPPPRDDSRSLVVLRASIARRGRER